MRRETGRSGHGRGRPPVAIEGGIDRLDHSLLVQVAPQEALEAGYGRRRIGHDVAVVDVEQFDVGLLLQPQVELLDMLLEDGGHLVVVHIVGVFAAMHQHLALRSQNLGHVTAHEDDLIGILRRQVGQQEGDDLHGLALRFG